MLHASGTLVYSPTLRKGSTIRRDGGSTLWWLIVACDPELGRLWRHLFALAHHRCRRAQEPLWSTHISVIRGEGPSEPEHWRKYADRAVEFRFEPDCRETEGFLWFPVECPQLHDIRAELGLSPNPEPPLYLTFGNTHAET